MKFFTLLIIFLISLFGKTNIDRIAIIVNNIPITTYDIQKMIKKTNNQNIAIETLINDALIKSAIKKRNIYIDDFDIEKRLEEIANKNNMSLFDFKTMLIQKGELNSFKDKIRKELEIQHLMSYYNKSITANDVKNYYDTHLNEFKTAKEIIATIYTSSNPKLLEKIKENPLLLSNNVNVENVKFNYKKTDPKIFIFLNKVNKNSFSPIISLSQNRYSLFYITDKKGNIILPFKEVEMYIFSMLIQKQKQKSITKLLENLRAKANIEYLK